MSASAFDDMGRRVPTARFKMPEHEDLVPDTPTDAIGRYVLLLRQWEDLTRRQATYEAELRKLHATGDALQAAWDALAADRQHCLDELGALDTPPHEVIERAWTLFKAQLFVLCQTATRGSSAVYQSVPGPITTLAEPLTRDPRLTP